MSSGARPYGYATFDTWFYDKSRRRRRQGTLCCLERYVRTDLDCGIASCREHADGSKKQSQIGVPYLIPDAESLYLCLQMLQKASEASSNDRMSAATKEIVCHAFQHVIVLETCFLQAKEWLPSQEFSRLQSFLRDKYTEESRFVSFVANGNSFYVCENWETSPHDILKVRESRIIAGTLRWYASSHPDVTFLHLASSPSTEVSIGSNVRVMSLEKYIESAVGDTDGRLVLELFQTMGQKVKDWIDVSEKSKSRLDEEDPFSGLIATEERSENFSVGIFEVNAYCSTEAFVRLKSRIEGFNADSVYICGSGDMKRAVHGDVVKVQIFPKHKWKVPTTERVLVHYTAQVEDESDDNPVLSSSASDDVLSVESTMSGWPTGRIISVLSRSHRVIMGTIPSKMIKGGDNTALAIPMSMRYPKVRIRSNHLDILTDKQLKIMIDSWPIDSAYPHGHYVGILGNVQDVTTEVSAILVENELVESPFSQAAIACLPRISEAVMESYQIAECCTAKRPTNCPLLEWEIPTEEFEMSLRRDLRTTHMVFSVDPAGCQDIDDAMSISVLSNGNIELGVHIADVSYFVKPESALDCEARRRGTSVYLVGQRLDMIPAVLSADLCSLHHSRDRLAVSVIWELDATSLAVVEDRTWIGRTAVRSCASLTYEQAHGILHNKPIPTSSIPNNVGMAGGDITNALKPQLREGLEHLTQIARTLERSRMQNGGLDLSRNEEIHIALGASTSKHPDVSVDSCETLAIHHTIAEIMILTNTTVAKKVFQAFPQHVLLRRHLPPSSSRFSQVLDIARVNGIEFDPTTNSMLQQSILRCENSGVMDSKTMALLKSLVVREMQQAEYICAHEALAAPRITAANANDWDKRIAHYGLGVECYTHFTSPIRRYADIVVHRQLLQVVQESSKMTKPPVLLPSPQSDTMPLDQADELLDDLIAHVHGELIECRPEETSRDVEVPLTDLIQMTHYLNVKHQSAKRASQQCKELFLALYFSENKIVTVGIITSLKENGFLVYLPEYDLRGPVYLCDRDNRVQMNPSLCGVPWHDCGEPTGAFAKSEYIRYIPHAKISMDGDKERLLVSRVNASSHEKPMCEFREFQHVEVQVMCNNMDTQSLRIEPLQFLLIGIPGKKTRQVKSKRLDTNNENREKFNIEHHVTERWKTGSILDASRVARERSESPLPKTLYEIISDMKGSHSQHISPPKKKTIGTSKRLKHRGPGRFIFGSSSSHQPEIPSSSYQANYMKARSPELVEAMHIRRHTAQPTSKNASAVVSEMEKDDGLGRRLGQAVQTRNFKLQAEKRHARVNKQKKLK